MSEGDSFTSGVDIFLSEGGTEDVTNAGWPGFADGSLSLFGGMFDWISFNEFFWTFADAIWLPFLSSTWDDVGKLLEPEVLVVGVILLSFVLDLGSSCVPFSEGNTWPSELLLVWFVIRGLWFIWLGVLRDFDSWLVWGTPDTSLCKLVSVCWLWASFVDSVTGDLKLSTSFLYSLATTVELFDEFCDWSQKSSSSITIPLSTHML